MNYANILSIFSRVFVGKRITLIATIHNHLTALSKASLKTKIWGLVCKIFFRYADCLTVPSNGVYQDVLKNYSGIGQCIEVIQHPLNIREVEIKAKEPIANIEPFTYILAVGRLNKQKDFATLIEAYSQICNEISENLVIIGEGEERRSLEVQIKELELEQRVFLLGYQENVYKYMSKAKVFVLSSLWESFAVVLIEALACKVPIISTDCPAGPREVLGDGKNGVLVLPANSIELAKNIKQLLDDSSLQKSLIRKAYLRACDFDVQKIILFYERLFLL